MITTAMILAAGRGERMRPLTDSVPKPMLQVADKPLIVWHLEKLAKAGIGRVVINLAHLGHVIEDALGDGSQFGLEICYSREEHGALETAGGIVQALPLLGDEPFWLVNGDVWTDFDFSASLALETNQMAHLVLVANPAHNMAGDFGIDKAGCLISKTADNTLTYAGIGVYSPKLFADCELGKAALAPLLKAQLGQQTIMASHHQGGWCDVGTPQRLADLDLQLKKVMGA